MGWPVPNRAVAGARRSFRANPQPNADGGSDVKRNSLPANLAAAALALAVALAAASPAAAVTEYTGTTAGGAHYKIMVPDGWDPAVGLVIWNHGFDLSPVGPVSDLGPLVDVQLAEGFAVAASSYRMPGWALFKTKQDLEGLFNAFRNRVGAPGRVFVTGGSLGGIVTAAAIETARIGNVVGAFTICGAMAGSRNWDGALDIRLLYDAICSEIPGAAIAGGAKGLLKKSDFTTDDLGAAVDACFGIEEKKARRSKKQKQRLKRFLALTGIPEEFVLIDMGYVTLALSDLVYDRAKLRGKLGFGNRDVVYGDAEIDAAIERVKPRKAAARKLKKNYTPTGKVGDVKIVSIHTDKDGLVIVENQSDYASKVPEESLTVGVVVEKTPSHCGFTPAEAVAGWEATVEWVNTGMQPTVEDLQTDCEAFAGLFGGPCRFDPDFEIPSLDERIRPR